MVAGTKKSWFPVVILFATAKEEVSHAMLCGQGRGEEARGYRLDSTVQPAQQCWQPTNNVNHDVGRACRMQPLETREQTPERKWRIFFPLPCCQSLFTPSKLCPMNCPIRTNVAPLRRKDFCGISPALWKSVRCRSNVSFREIKDKNFKRVFKLSICWDWRLNKIEFRRLFVEK